MADNASREETIRRMQTQDVWEGDEAELAALSKPPPIEVSSDEEREERRDSPLAGRLP